MKKGSIIAVLILGAGILIAANGLVYVSSDRKGPEIKLALGQDTYYAAEGKASLLNGVTATDNRDGDVTDTLRVASILPNADNTKVSVTYTAKDSSNNVTSLSTTMNYSATTSGDATEPDQEAPTQEPENPTPETDETTPAEAGTESTPETPSTDTEEASTESDETEMRRLVAGAPKFRLTTHTARLSVGEEWHYYDYIAELTDDKDSRNELFSSIVVDGKVDTSTPGTYEVVYHVTDSNGNSSNRPKLTVIVE